MTDPGGYAKALSVPAGFDASRLLRYDDITTHAITRDVRGQSAPDVLAAPA